MIYFSKKKFNTIEYSIELNILKCQEKKTKNILKISMINSLYDPYKKEYQFNKQVHIINTFYALLTK